MDREDTKKALDEIRRELDGQHVPGLPRVLGLCDICARKTPVRLQIYPVIHCPHNEVGAYFNEDTGQWLSIQPVALREFALAMGVMSAAIKEVVQSEAPPAGERH